jgi:hypothetical protein
MRWIRKWLRAWLPLALPILFLSALPLSAQFGDNATKLRGKAICNPSAPSDGNALSWSAAKNCWDTGAGGTSSSVWLSRATGQSGIDNTCLVTSSSSSAYVCAAVGNPITAYPQSMRILVTGITPVTGGGAITLDAGNGAKPVYQNDGTSNPTTAQWAAGEDVWLTYNSNLGASGGWRILSGASGGSAAPTNWYPVTSANSNGGGVQASGWYSTSGAFGAFANKMVYAKFDRGSSEYAQIALPIPSSTTGAFSLSFLMAWDNFSFTSTASIDYQCYVAGTTYLGGAFVPTNLGTFSHAVVLADYEYGLTYTISGTHACAGGPGNMLLIRFSDTTTGDNTKNLLLLGMYATIN